MLTPVHWVVQGNQGNPAEVEAIVRVLEAQGAQVHLVLIRKGQGVPDIPDLPADVPIVCHGAGFVTRAEHHPRLAEGLFFDAQTFRWSAFQEGWRGAMLSSDGVVLPLSQARDEIKIRGLAFARPDADSKSFDGGVYNHHRFCEATDRCATESMLVVLAEPITIEAEWRFFIVNGEIAGCSEYRRWGQLSTSGAVPRTAIDLAAESAQRWGPAAIYCLDLAAAGDRIGIVEANCFNASRLYGAAIDRVLRAVNSHVASTNSAG